MNFEKYIDRIDEIMQDTENKLAALDTAIQTERDQIQNARRGAKPGRLAALDEERQEKEKTYRESTAAVIAEARKDVSEARNALESEVKDFGVLHPEEVDSAALAILNAGIAGADDLIHLANEHGGSPTMLRLIASNAERLMDSDPTARNLVAQIRTFIDPEARLDVFDGAVLNAHIGAAPALFNIARDAWTEHAYPRFKADMKELNTFTFQEG